MKIRKKKLTPTKACLPTRSTAGRIPLFMGKEGKTINKLSFFFIRIVCLLKYLILFIINKKMNQIQVDLF